jgi:hypothetical protein
MMSLKTSSAQTNAHEAETYMVLFSLPTYSPEFKKDRNEISGCTRRVPLAAFRHTDKKATEVGIQKVSFPRNLVFHR